MQFFAPFATILGNSKGERGGKERGMKINEGTEERKRKEERSRKIYLSSYSHFLQGTTSYW